MKIGRLLVVSVTPCFAWAFVVGCGSDGSGFRGAPVTGGSSGASSGAAGAGGAGASGAGAGGMSAGAAGVGGAGGSAQGSEGGATNAGSGGAISAGRAGDAGASTAGVGGLAGAAGTAGDASAGNAGIGMGGAGAAAGGATAGGAMGGAGAVSGSGGSVVIGGFGGTGGSGVAGGASGPLRTCGERCTTTTDCRIFGLDQGYQCNQTTRRCERFASPCRSSVECIPEASFWIFACRSDADCFFFSDDVCIDAGGVGRCARLAPSASGCMDPNPDAVTLPRFGTSGTALVCANASLTCDGGECVAGCRTNADCTPERNGSVCDAQTRLCRCVRDQDCGGSGVSRCNTTNGRCECRDARDCEDVSNADACFSGRCGCSGTSACNADRTFSGTTIVCE